MSTPTATQQPAPHSAIRRLVARHPVAAFLVMVYTVSFAFTLPPVRAQLDILPTDWGDWRPKHRFGRHKVAFRPSDSAWPRPNG